MVWIYVRTPEEPKCMRISLHFPQWLALNRLVLASILKSGEIPISQVKAGRFFGSCVRWPDAIEGWFWWMWKPLTAPVSKYGYKRSFV